MFIGEEAIIAKCYIERESDEDNVCYLSHDNLYVKSKGIMNHFQLESIMNIGFKRKLLLFPVVVGGIISSFSLVALFNGLYNVWLMLCLMIGGLALLFYGAEGSNTLSVQTNVKEYDFFIKSPTPNLRSFVSFLINFQHKGEDALIYYIVIDQKVWDQAQTSGYINVDSPMRLNAQRSNIDENQVELVIDLAKSNIEVEYIMNKEQNKLVPIIKKNIRISDITIPNS